MSLFENIRSYIIHPFVAGPLGGSIIVLLSYIDSIYRDIERDNNTYFKLFIVSSLVFSTITYFVYMEHKKIDEFLDQPYDVNPPMVNPQKKFNKGRSIELPLTSSNDRVSELMESLSQPTNPKLEVHNKNVTMNINKV